MAKDRTISVTHDLYECGVGPMSCGDDLILLRAPVVRDGSGSYKRLPHQIQWEHIQEGDAIIAMRMHDGPSGQAVLDILQFWNVISKDDEDCFTVHINNIVGMAGDGKQVYNSIVALVGLPPEQ